jgi:hypothetical protein
MKSVSHFVNKKYLIYTSFLFVAMIVSRIIPHPWNFTAIGAGSFILPVVIARSGLLAYLFRSLNTSKAIVPLSMIVSVFVSLSALFVSDLLLGFYVGMVFVYLATLLCVVLGFLFQDLLIEVLDGREISFPMMKAGSGQMLGSLLFFGLTNFSVWFHSGMYTKNLDGLLMCYTMALPFLKWQLMGDLFYLSIFVGGYKLFQIKSRHALKTWM